MSKILKVEDEAALRDTIAYNLRPAGHEVHAVSDGDAALKAVPRESPDSVILDAWCEPSRTGCLVEPTNWRS